MRERALGPPAVGCLEMEPGPQRGEAAQGQQVSSESGSPSLAPSLQSAAGHLPQYQLSSRVAAGLHMLGAPPIRPAAPGPAVQSPALPQGRTVPRSGAGFKWRFQAECEINPLLPWELLLTSLFHRKPSSPAGKLLQHRAAQGALS